MEVLIFDYMSECTEHEVQRMLPLVSVQRRKQALRYKHTFGQFCCLKSWLMVRELLERVGYNRFEFDEFRFNPNGKPYIEGGPYFSISHCKEGIAVAVDDEPIGIDIEGIRRADKELIERVMNDEEQAQIKSDRDFTRFWTQKEAVVKMQGTGIQSFEQLQCLLSGCRNTGVPEYRIETIEHEKYIYSIAYGKLCSIGAEVQAADL